MSPMGKGKVFVFSRPVEFEGTEYKQIDFDLESLTGNDMLAVERQFLASGVNQSVMVKEFNKEYQALVAARAAKLPFEFFQSIGARDFSRVTIAVQNFFLEAESAE